MNLKTVCNRCLKISGCVEEINSGGNGKVKRCSDCDEASFCRDSARRLYRSEELDKKTIFLKCDDCLADDCLG